MNTTEKTPEELRMEMYEKLRIEQGSSQHLCEVATPGVVREVNDDEMKR